MCQNNREVNQCNLVSENLSVMLCTEQVIKLEIEADCLSQFIECWLLGEYYNHDFNDLEF